MTLQQLAYLIAQVLTGQISLLAAIDKINRQLAGNATEATAEAILTETVSTDLVVTNGTTGLVNAYNQARTDTATILAAIGAITPTPPAPPPSAGDIADAVWLRTDPNSTPSHVYGDEIWEGFLAAQTHNIYGLTRNFLAPFFAYCINDNRSGVTSLTYFPEPDWTDIRPDDTRLTWLQRTDPDLTWDDGGTAGTPHGVRVGLPTPVADWYFLLTEAEFNALKATAANSLPPIWPGLANVVLGTPVALVPDLTITTPMHGVVIEITGVASKYNSFKFSYDGLTSYRKLGALTFLTDRGDAEMFQMLSFELAVYCPTKMAEAASVKLECATGTTGTITPWLRKQP